MGILTANKPVELCALFTVQYVAAVLQIGGVPDRLGLNEPDMCLMRQSPDAFIRVCRFQGGAFLQDMA